MRSTLLFVAAATAIAVAQAAAPLTFADVTTAAGIRFTHTNGAFGQKYLPETMGSGAIVFDADNDGDQDLFFANGKGWPGHPPANALPAFYKNNGTGGFVESTSAAGLAVSLYGMGGAAADYDNDGDADLFLTALGGNRLFRNNGAGVFTDVTAAAGLAGSTAFGTSAAFFDYDKDGVLDLYVVNYVQWSVATDIRCSLDGKTKSYCTPEAYKGASPILYKGGKDGRFTDVTKAAGLLDPAAKALGIALLDYDGDGWLDLFVANDTRPNRLYRNTGKGTFTDEAVTAGVAFNDAGVPRAGMGTDAADYDGSGRPSLVVGNFSNEMIALYHNEGGGLFIDEAPGQTVGQTSMLTLTFACLFFDADLDGRPDLFAANGHVADDINAVQPKIKYAQPAHLFRNLGQKRFEAITDKAGPALQKPVVARGAAYLDADRDGDLDLVVTENNGPARLLRNEGGNRQRWLRVTLQGTKSNRSAIGAIVTATLPGGAKRWAMVKTGSSYLSQSELPLTFGLGAEARVTGLEVRWPSGQVDTIGSVEANRAITIVEGQGLAK
jgi:enediyne biosynthesis protein E4